MFDQVISFLSTPYGSALSVFGAVLASAKFWGRYIHPTAKENIAHWLHGAYEAQWHSGFLKLFHTIFDERFLSRRFFVATAVMSFSFVILGLLISIVAFAQHNGYSPEDKLTPLFAFISILIGFGLPNYLFDILSVILSVKIFEYLGSSGYFKQLLLYLFDIACSLMIGLLTIVIFSYAMEAMFNKSFGQELPSLLEVITSSSASMFDFFYSSIKGIEPEDGFRLTFLYLPAILSALFTTLCALVYILTTSIMRFFSLKAVNRTFYIDNYPVELLGISLGVALGLVTFVVTALG